MKEIYNEGRVQGYNAYEIYVRQMLNLYPDCKLPSEQEWLSSILNNGLGMILKVKAKTKAGYHDYPLPKNSKLCASSTIIATAFDGQCKFDADDRWATTVIDYGPLCSNTRQLHPETPGDSATTYPVQPVIDYHTTSKLLKDYIKIVDGLVYQPGEWTYPEGTDTGHVDEHGDPIIDYPNRKPFMNFIPDLTKSGVVRLHILNNITNDTYLLLTGFTDKIALRPVFNNETGIINTPDPQDGDFLGPEVFPWATKILFFSTNEIFNMYMNPPYGRKIALESNEKIVNAQPVIDMSSLNPISYYQQKHMDSAVDVNVTFLNPNGDYAGVLTVYQREDKDIGDINARQYPPVLYAAKVGAEGEQKMVPLDVAAPGTIKVIDNIDLALAYPKLIPNVYAIYKDENNNLFYVDENSDEDTMVDISSKVSIENIGTAAHPIYQAVITSGNHTVKVPSCTDEDGQPLDKLHFGTEVEFDKPVTQPNLTLQQNDFITFGNGLRFYVSNTEPVNDGNIPIGSIGIGW